MTTSNQPVAIPTPGFCGVRLVSTGIGLPEKVVSNEELVKTVDTTAEWISQRTGIQTRRLVEPGTTSRNLASMALKMALENGGMDPKELDMVLVASITPEMVCPSTAAQVVADVGAVPAAALDINAACSGFVYGLNLAASLIRTGQCKNVAVIGAETLSTITDWKDRRTCILFGDGAAAAILSRSDNPAQGPVKAIMCSDGSGWHELYCPRGPHNVPAGDKIFSGTFNTLQMNGQAIFKFAVSTFQKVIDDTLAAAGVSPEDLSMIVAHQSNIRILESARDRMGLPPEKLYINIDRYGNTSGASVPICLHELMAAGRIKSGDWVLFVGIGGGLTWASSLWKI